MLLFLNRLCRCARKLTFKKTIISDRSPRVPQDVLASFVAGYKSLSGGARLQFAGIKKFFWFGNKTYFSSVSQ